jgi:ankyrin repeat protein
LRDSTTDVNGLNYCGNTPAHYAVAHDDMKVLFVLLRHGADLNIESRYKGESAMHLLYTVQQQVVKEWQTGRVRKLESDKREKKEQIKQLQGQLARLQKEMGQLYV